MKSHSERPTHLIALHATEGYNPVRTRDSRELGALSVSLSAELSNDDAPKTLARQLIDKELTATSGNGAAAASQLLERVYVGLARSFGPYGALALVTRAIARKQNDHPVLANIVINVAVSPHVTGPMTARTAEESVAIIEAAIAVLDSLHESLIRLIGDDLAATLLGQRDAARVPSPTETSVSPNASKA